MFLPTFAPVPCCTLSPPAAPLAALFRPSEPRQASVDCHLSAATNEAADRRRALPPSLPLPSRVRSWRTRRPCAGKFTAPCNHLLCRAGVTLELLHLLERSALCYKCAISIHEGIYMHSQTTLTVLISHSSSNVANAPNTLKV